MVGQLLNTDADSNEDNKAACKQINVLMCLSQIFVAEYEDGDGSSFQPGESVWKAEINAKKEGKKGRILSVGADLT